MKPFRSRFKKTGREGFSLAESAISIGFVSFGFLSLIPLLSLGLKTARQAHDYHATSQIAQTLIEEAKQGTLASSTAYLDNQGNSCDAASAIYTAQSTSAAVTAGPGGASGLTRLTLRVAPVGAPGRARTYVVVFPASP